MIMWAIRERELKYIVPGDIVAKEKGGDTRYIVDCVEGEYLMCHNEKNPSDKESIHYNDVDYVWYKQEDDGYIPTTVEECNDRDMGCPCCDSADVVDEEGNSLDIWDYIPEDTYPKEATQKGRHKYLRETGWIQIDRINESNKEVVDECLKQYRKDNPEKTEGKSDYVVLSENDDIWDKYALYDALVLNSLRNKDYVLDYDEKTIRDFDVIIQETIGGYVCNPIVVYDISHNASWGAGEEWDDYANEKLAEMMMWRRRHDNRDTSKDWMALQCKLLREGHATWRLYSCGTEHRHAIRWVNRNEKDERHKVHHSQW